METGFIPEPAAGQLLRRLIETIPWELRSINFAGRSVPQPRLVAWLGDPGKTYSYSGQRFDPIPWPAWYGLAAAARVIGGRRRIQFRPPELLPNGTRFGFVAQR